MADKEFDVLVIGAGPGGYVSAIKAAQLGLKVACVEKEKTLGGTCLNIGCIPSKALLESSHHFYSAKHEFEEHGISASKVAIDVKKMIERKNAVVTQLTGGVEFLFKKNKVERLAGTARFTSANSVDVAGTEVKAKHIIIASGSIPGSLPNIEIDEEIIVSSTGALSFQEVPKKLVVVGGGYIGLEMSSVWSRLGSDVEVIEYLDKVIPLMDSSQSDGLKKVLEKQGMKFRMGTAVKEIKKKGKSAVITIEKDGKTETIEADRVLMSVGRRPVTDSLDLEKAGLKATDRGFLEVNDRFETSVKGIYAIGDVIGGKMLAHKAEEEGMACVEFIHGEVPEVRYDLIPSILYTFPEVASVGYTEAELKEKGTEFKSSQFKMVANGRAISMGETSGFVKILADKTSGELLGAHLMCPNASEMIHEFCIAMEFGAKAEDIALTMHGHPTLSEAVKEAAMGISGKMIHS